MLSIHNEHGEVIHIIIREEDISTQKTHRQDVVSPNEFIQVALLRLRQQQSFPAHIHNVQKKETNLTQEAWVVIKGKVAVIYYDESGKRIGQTVLFAGECSITLRGGHSYTSLEENTLVYEFKTGPYLGVEADKRFIN